MSGHSPHFPGPPHRHWHHAHHRGRWRLWHLNPLARYAQARLQRRVFFWFAASILFTGVIFLGLTWFTGGSSAAWRARLEGAGEVLATPFAERWTDPARRTAWGELVSRQLHVALELKGPQGEPLEHFGAPRGQAILLQTVRGPTGEALGSVEVYAPTGGRGFRWQMTLPFLFALLLLWGAAGRLSLRLTRPLMEVTKMAQALGAGELTRRMRPLPRGGFEAQVLALALNDMADRIEKQLKDQRELLATVSHELRTPLARIRLLTELARTNERSVATLDELDREVVEVDALVGELLARSRLDFAALSLRPLDGVDVAQRALERAGLPDALLEVEGEAAALEADATLLLRALANLLENARRHGGQVERLRVRATRGTVSFDVEDAGPGFAPGEAARLFQSFARGNAQPGGDSTGLGLGLVLVRRIAEAHRGRVLAENREGGGARVRLELPTRQSVAPDPA